MARRIRESKARREGSNETPVEKTPQQQMLEGLATTKLGEVKKVQPVITQQIDRTARKPKEKVEPEKPVVPLEDGILTRNVEDEISGNSVQSTEPPRKFFGWTIG